MSDVARRWDAAYRRKPSAGYGAAGHHEDAELLARLFARYEVKRILDLGSGDGRHLVYFAQRGYEMCGLDCSPTALRLAESWLSREGLSAELAHGRMSALPWPDRSFDAVVCTQAIAETRRVLRPGGWLFLTVSTARPEDPVNCVQIAPHTYLLPKGHREEGVPHYCFDMETLLREFAQFDLVDPAGEMPDAGVANLHVDRHDKTCLFARRPEGPAHRYAPSRPTA